MSFFVAILLGILQGLTEFFPVSSSGHLALFGAWFGMDEPDLTFDILLHLATLAAILVYFRQDWIQLFQIFRGSKPTDMPKHVIPFLILATIPAVIVGFAFKDAITIFHSHPEWVGICLLVTGGALLAGLFIKDKGRPYQAMTWGIVLMMGIAQATALLPGISRSGITIMVGIFLGLNRTASARFSFLMAVPVIGGAGVLAAVDLLERGSQLPASVWAAYTAGFLAAFASGFFALTFLMRLLRGNRFFFFGFYCLFMAVASWCV